jgi:hypothetical protein
MAFPDCIAPAPDPIAPGSATSSLTVPVVVGALEAPPARVNSGVDGLTIHNPKATNSINDPTPE